MRSGPNLIRRRCEEREVNAEEQFLLELLAELKTATKGAEESLDLGLTSMAKTVVEIRARKAR